MSRLTTIAFDADDTLWVNEPIFTNTRLQFEEILSHYITIDGDLETELYAVEKRNLELFGYGIKGFMLSMIESALEITSHKISGQHIEQIISLGKEMLTHPVEVLPGVVETLEKLKSHYQLVIITKGDLWDQEQKIARSSLADYFDIVEIVSEKNPKTYAEVFSRNKLNINELVMIGNSLKSDVLPICELGGLAIHIPFHDTWAHERTNPQESHSHDYKELASMHEVVDFIRHLSL